MKTKITEMCGIKYPILLSGMSWVALPKLVAAVSNAGGLGMLATGPMSPDQTKQAIQEIRSLTDKPFGANATLLLQGGMENADVMLKEKVPVINFSLGKGDWIVKRAHEYGGKVFATVVNIRHAKRAQDYGSDGVIATGHEAAAHGDDATTFILVPRLAESIDIPIVAAGGIGNGRGLAAALALGAEGVAMGTRFMTTQESPLHPNYKKLSIEKDIGDTIFSDRFDGMLARMMKTPAAEKAAKEPVNLWKVFMNSQAIAKEMQLPYSKVVMMVLGSGIQNARQLFYMAQGFKGLQDATQTGDTETGILPVGQCQGLIHDEPTVAEVIENIVAEAKKAQLYLSAQFTA
ncbi:MAG: nitronate monooxygenase [Deltaproteobacteria bacterium]|nr:nitronate monooxygenase [Deltaproteobacteria bacterium]